jgi:hypothetical protein
MGSPANEAVAALSSFSSAIIDTSSLIYLSKIHCLSILAESCRLFSIQEVIDEFDEGTGGIEIIALQSEIASTDQKLLRACIVKDLPLISEDRKLLLDAYKNNILYFNSLMMLNYLLLKNKISQKEYISLLEKLKSIARYGKDVWRFGAEVNNVISNLSR